MNTEIILVRHGQTQSNITGYYMGDLPEDMNETGYEQVRRVAKRLARLNIKSINTSPLKRTVNTARIIGQPHLLEPVNAPGLTELDIGDWQGLYRQDIKLRYSDIWQQWREDPSNVSLPHGESVPQLVDRVVNTFNEIVKSNQDELSVIVTHDIVIKTIITHVLGISNKAQRFFEVANASYSLIRWRGNTPRVITLNDTSHLEDD